MVADSTTMLLDDLPPELFGDIFKFLIYDKASLRACTSVSTRWHRLARRYRFAVIKVVGWSGRYERFFAFCRARPDLAVHIRELTFVGGSELTPDGRSEPFVFRYEEFLSILPILVSLRTLCFLSVQMSGDLRLNDVPGAAAQAPLTSLDVLEFKRYAQEPAGLEFLSVLSSILSFVSVDTLQISGRVPLRFLEPSVEALSSCFRIRQLAIVDVDPVHDYFQFFECVTEPDALRAVALQCGPLEGRPSHSLDIVRFLSSEVARSLVSVDLDFSGIKRNDMPESTREALGAALAGCTQLMYLRLGLFGWAHSSVCRRGCESYPPVPQPPMLVPLLTSLPPSFRVLSLRLRVRCQEDGDWWTDCVPHWDLEKLDEICAPGTASDPGRFPNLQSVMLDVHPDDEDRRVKTLEEYDAPLLPKLQAAGMLRTRVVRERWMNASGRPFYPE